jgi:hypothetical protein
MSYQEQEAKQLKAEGMANERIAEVLRISEAQVEKLLLGGVVVRVVCPRGGQDFEDMLTFQERAGHVVVHRKDDSICFDLLPPLTEVSGRWAKRVAGFMRTCNWNAQEAPRWA